MNAASIRAVPGSCPRRKEVCMEIAMSSLAIALLVAVLVIDRLVR